MSTVATSSDTVRDFESTIVYYAETLGGDWIEVPFLEPQILERFAGPDIDRCTFLYRYGRYAGRNLEPLNLNRFYVKLVVRDLVAEPAGGNPTPASIDAAAHLIWYGVVEAYELDAGGTKTVSVTAIPHGDETITAYGLLRELETTIVRTATVATSDGNWQEIGRGLTFNEQRQAKYTQRGNRTENVSGGYNGFIYSFESQKQSIWTAHNAVQYLLKFHAPKDKDGITNASWALIASASLLDWFDISEATEGRSVKDIIDDLIDRRRIVGYWLDTQETASGFECNLIGFSFTPTTITLPDEKQIPANTDQITIDFESSFDVEAKLTNNTAHKVDVVRARGDFITSTFTTWLSATMLKTGWISGDETAYLAAGSAAGDYPADEADQEAFNQRARSDDKYEDVFSKFVMRDDWNLQVPEKFDSPAVNFNVTASHDLLDNGTADDVTDVFEVSNVFEFNSKLAPRYHRFLSHLPIRSVDADDYSEFRPCFALFKTDETAEDADDHIWEYADKLNATAATDSDADERRQFSCRLHSLDEQLGIRLTVGAAGAQQLIAKENWSGAATTNDRYDPTTPDGNGVDFNKMVVTVCMEWDDHAEYVEGQGQSGVPVRELLIQVPSVRLDFLIPGTVTGVDASGKLVRDETGAIIRDDRKRLEQIAKAAYQWYSKERQALVLSWKSLAALKDADDNKVKIGWLVTSVGVQYSLNDVNSPITGWVHDFVRGTQTIETSFAAFDLGTVERELRI